MTIEAFTKLRTEVESGAVSPEDGWNSYYALVRRRPWAAKDWKRLRDTTIGTECCQCGTEDGPMVAQHLWHPEKRSEIEGRFLRTWEDYKEENPQPEMTNIVRPGCPLCPSTRKPYYRKRTDDWRCQTCDGVFPQPVDREVPDRETRAQKARQNYGRYQTERDRQRQSVEVQRLSLQEMIDQKLRYLSLVDVVTMCRRCAFLWDVKRRKPCPQCKEGVVRITAAPHVVCGRCSGDLVKCAACGDRWHGSRYEACLQCTGRTHGHSELT